MAKPNSGIDNVGKPAGLTGWIRMALRRVYLIDHRNVHYARAAVLSIAALGIACGVAWLGVETGSEYVTLAGLALIVAVELFWAVAGIIIGCKLILLVLGDYRASRRDRPDGDRSRMQ